MGAVFEVGNSRICRFWEDSWIRDAPLKIVYNDLYQLVRDPMIHVADCYEEGSWGLTFRRCLSVQQYDRWLSLLELLNGCSLTDNRADRVMWALENRKMFTTKSLYRFLTDGGVKSRVAGLLWKSRVPLKIKFFLWQILNDKLQVAVNLVKRGWKGPIICCLCNCVETIDHIFFECHLAVMIWEMLKEIFHLDSYPRSWEDFCSTWLRGKGLFPIRLIIFMFSGFAWALWTSRNKMAINKKFP